MSEFVRDLMQIPEPDKFLKWRFDRKGSWTDPNTLKRKIKESLKSTEGQNIISGLIDNSMAAGALRVKDLFYEAGQLSPDKVDVFIDNNFDRIFNY